MPSTAPIDYLLHLADNALVLGQRNAEWCGHGPVLEEDIALTNISLDLVGQARMLYQHAAKILTPPLVAEAPALPPGGAFAPWGGPAALMAPTLAAGAPALPPGGAFAPWGGPAALMQGGGATEDSLAYFREARQFRNYTLVELPQHGALAPGAAADRDYATTIARNFLYSAFMLLLWDALQQSADAQLAAIAAKSLKEVRYHLRHSSDWLVRLGDGTDKSHARTQAAVDHLMPYTQEFWTVSAHEAQAAASQSGIDPRLLQAAWDGIVNDAFAQATLTRPTAAGHLTRGKEGAHSEHLSYLLAEMQSLARQHPGAQW